MTRYRAVVLLNRFGEWRDTRTEAMQDAVDMGEGRKGHTGRIYLKPGVRIDEMW